MLAIAVVAAQQTGHARMMPKLPAAIALARTGEEAQATVLLMEYLRAEPNDPLALGLEAELTRARPGR